MDQNIYAVNTNLLDFKRENNVGCVAYPYCLWQVESTDMWAHYECPFHMADILSEHLIKLSYLVSLSDSSHKLKLHNIYLSDSSSFFSIFRFLPVSNFSQNHHCKNRRCSTQKNHSQQTLVNSTDWFHMDIQIEFLLNACIWDLAASDGN